MGPPGGGLETKLVEHPLPKEDWQEPPSCGLIGANRRPPASAGL